MDAEYDLTYIYKDETIDLADTYEDGIVDILFTDLFYYKDGEQMKVESYPTTSITNLIELDYFNKNIDKYESNIRIWLEAFESHARSVSEADDEGIKEHEKMRWDEDEIPDKEDYEDFEEWWDGYYDSQAYYEEVSFLEEQYWNDFKEEYGEGYEVLSKTIDGEWFDSYGNLQIRSLWNDIESLFTNLKSEVKEFEASVYSHEDFDSDEELAEHFNKIFDD